MALDGCGNLCGSHDWLAPKSRTVEHERKEDKAVEEDMVVDLHA